MKVLYLAPPGRSATQLSRYSFLDEEMRALAEAGVDVYVFDVDGDADRDDGRVHRRSLPARAGRWLSNAGFMRRRWRAVPVRNRSDLRECYHASRIEAAAADVIAAEQIDLVHSYFAWPRGFGGSLASAATGRPLVAALRGNDVNMNPALGYGARRNPSFDRALRHMLRYAATTVYVSEFLRRQALQLGAIEGRSRVVYKGVRLDVFSTTPSKEAARRSLGIGPEPMLLAVAGLIPIKGVRQIIESLGLLAQTHAFSLKVCGKGHELAALEQLCVRLGLEDRVSFLGQVERSVIPQFFAAADAFVHGSVIEASGNAILEAMASGLPVVCTDAGGPGEYVEHGTCGYVVPVGDAAAMADGLRRLLDDAALREQMGAASRRRATERFGYDRMIDEILATYESVLAAPAMAS